MSEQEKKYRYRICPCDPYDIEGIQSWLEDMAAKGLLLAPEEVFYGVFTFECSSPRKMTYRLDVAQKRKPRFFSTSALTEEEKELYRSMGWEYLLQHGEFRIYRALEPDAPELNTESSTHAMTMGFLKKSQRQALFATVLMVLLWLLHTGSALRYSCLNAVYAGLLFTICAYGLLLYGTVKPMLRFFRIKRYEKRLLAGESLTRRRDWRRTAPRSYCFRALPFLFVFGIAFGILSTLARTDKAFPVETYPAPPFATLSDTFPNASDIEENDWMDYGTAKTWKNALAENAEWNESCSLTTDSGENFFCILRLDYHETATEWLARGLEENYYVYDSTRYRGKRFTDLEVPDLGVDSVRAYNSYGSFYVLMREGNRVVHAVVLLDNGENQNQWLLWAEAMAKKFLA